MNTEQAVLATGGIHCGKIFQLFQQLQASSSVFASCQDFLVILGGLNSQILQDSRAKYGKFVRPSRVIEEGVAENNQTDKVGRVQSSLKPSSADEHEEVLGASVEGFGPEVGEKTRWGKCSHPRSANSL